jgi:MoxR-like ATPase
MTVLPQIQQLKKNIAQDIVGQSEVIDHLLISMLINGNLLMEGLPGLAKTRAIKSLSKHIQCDFNRIQFTPDLTPQDVTGREIMYTDDEGVQRFKFEKGPVFANLVLADEINRTQPKVQSRMLEAMEERQVTNAGITYKLPKLFMVMATMNPVEQEGTNPMPEAQLDRFSMHVMVDYPDEEAEVGIVRLVRNESRTLTEEQEKAKAEEFAKKKKDEAETATDQTTVFAARREIDAIVMPEAVERYIVDLVFATRYPERYSYQLKSCIKVGVSPRGSLALDRCSRAHAWLMGQSEVTPDNIYAIINSVLHHRIPITDLAKQDNVIPEHVIEEIIKEVKKP